jgi:DNA repair protein SbcD/Mre11
MEIKRMKILHTSDWHLGKKLGEFSRLEEQKEVMDEIVNIAESNNVDAVLVAGDLFDTFVPSSDATDLFFRSVKRLTGNGIRPVIAIAGNHDSPDRIEAPAPLAKECGIIFAGQPDYIAPDIDLETGVKTLKSEPGFIELKLPSSEHPLRIISTAYANEFRLKKFLGVEDSEENLRKVLEEKWRETAEKHCDDKGVNILLSHLFFMKKGGEKPKEPENEKPIDFVGGAQAIFTNAIPKQLQYVALGHLHRLHEIDSEPCPVVYSGSPLAYSFSEADQDKYVIIINAEPGKDVKYEKIKLEKGRRLHRKEFNSIAEAVVWLEENKNILVELTIVTENYLSVNDQKALFNTSDGIISIAPKILNNNTASEDEEFVNAHEIEISELFRKYFFSKQGVEPNEEIMDLFKEVLSERGIS